MTRIRLYQWLGVSILGVATGCGSTALWQHCPSPTAPRGVALVYANKGTASQSPRTYKQATPMAPAYVNQAGYQVMTMPNGEGVVTADHSVVEGARSGRKSSRPEANRRWPRPRPRPRRMPVTARRHQVAGARRVERGEELRRARPGRARPRRRYAASL